MGRALALVILFWLASIASAWAGRCARCGEDAGKGERYCLACTRLRAWERVEARPRPAPPAPSGPQAEAPRESDGKDYLLAKPMPDTEVADIRYGPLTFWNVSTYTFDDDANTTKTGISWQNLGLRSFLADTRTNRFTSFTEFSLLKWDVSPPAVLPTEIDLMNVTVGKCAFFANRSRGNIVRTAYAIFGLGLYRIDQTPPPPRVPISDTTDTSIGKTFGIGWVHNMWKFEFRRTNLGFFDGVNYGGYTFSVGWRY